VALSVASCRSSLAATGLAGAHHTLLSGWSGRRECKRRSSPASKELQPGLVIRARTVTSNGMSNVRPAAAVGASASPISAAQQAFLSSNYAISAALLERTNRWLVEHERQVAASQLEGRCNPGFSCKAAAASGLQVLAKGRRMRDDPHGGCELWQMAPPDPHAKVRQAPASAELNPNSTIRHHNPQPSEPQAPGAATAAARSCAVCVVGQLSRLELESKVRHLVKPNLRAGHTIALLLVLSQGTAQYVNSRTRRSKKIWNKLRW